MAQKNILIIDDDAFLLDMYTIKFKEQGYGVESVTSAEEALKKIKDGFIPSVILFDVVMPGVDGIEFLATLKKENLTPDALLIGLSNQGEDRDVEKAKAAGAHEYIVKANMVPSEVLQKVSEVIKMHNK